MFTCGMQISQANTYLHTENCVKLAIVVVLAAYRIDCFGQGARLYVIGLWCRRRLCTSILATSLMGAISYLACILAFIHHTRTLNNLGICRIVAF